MTTTETHSDPSLPSYRGRLAMPLQPTSARVCVVIPTRNEAAHIAETIQTVLQQTFPRDRTQVVLVDGLSTDGTRDIIARFQSSHAHVRMVDNPAGITPVALNIGIAATTAEVIVRVDGHCRIAPTYVERCVDLLARSRAANVGGLMRPEGRGTVGRAIAVAMRSRFGIGNARFHYLEREAYVDTVYLGAFRRHVLEEIGGFDEELVRNQDDELNFRIRKAGYGILLSPEIRSTYTPRDSLPRLLRQFYQYGWWKIRVIQKHRGSMQLRHLAPPSLAAVLLLSVFAFAVTRAPLLLMPLAAYTLSTLAVSLWLTRLHPIQAPVLTLVFACMHLGYGSGFLAAAVRALFPASHPGTNVRSAPTVQGY